jgi:hypothetical protein
MGLVSQNQLLRMSKHDWFLTISILLVFLTGVISFRSFRHLGQSLYWMLFPNLMSYWFKDWREKDILNTMRFEFFLVRALLILGLNYLIFKYLI